MKFRNPWIDPRVLQVMPAEAEAYLLNHGWIRVPSSSSHFHGFASSSDPAKATVVGVAQLTDGGDYPQRVIDLIAALAFAEDRWATDVLSDVLQAKNAPAPVNGSGSPRSAESAASCTTFVR